MTNGKWKMFAALLLCSSTPFLLFSFSLVPGPRPLAPSSMSPPNQKHETGFLNRSMIVGGQTYRYQVYLPVDYVASKHWPVVLYLHGAGERGDDGLLETEIGIGSALRRYAARYPCIVVFPQCRK